MKPSIFVLPVALLLTGCVSFMRTPPDLAYIQRDRVNSGKVSIRSFELLRLDGEVLVVGEVGRLSNYYDKIDLKQGQAKVLPTTLSSC